MSKRHQSSRRRSYGRRQHELAERRGRELPPEPSEAEPGEYRASAIAGRLGLLDAGAPRLAFSLGD